MEALPNASAVLDRYGGAEYVLYRKDRVIQEKGRELLKSFTLEQSPKTERVYSTCCNSAMMMRFNDVRHWVPIYRARLGSSAPPIELRMCTSFVKDEALPEDVPSHRDYPPSFMIRLLLSGMAMVFRR